MAETSLRPRRADDLGLRRALSDRLLPLLVAAMSFLAALCLACAIATAGLAHRWQGGAAALVTVQVPRPQDSTGGRTRQAAVAAVFSARHDMTARLLTPEECLALLRPWLGEAATPLSVTLPAVFELRLTQDGVDVTSLAASVTQAAPGSLVERNGVWAERLGALAASLRACAALAVAVVAFVAAAVLAVATRAGLAARRDAIEIVHGLGATDGKIAGQFARRVTTLTLFGSLLGIALAIPLLLSLASLTAPFQGAAPPVDAPDALLGMLPKSLWQCLPALPLAACLIAWLTAQATVRLWLARLP